MKKVLFSVVLLLAASVSFAQVKAVKEAKSIANGTKPDFSQAEELINEAMQNPETKDRADTWDVAGFIQKRYKEEQDKLAALKQPYDTLASFSSILKMYAYYVKCDELAELPNEKGKVNNKYHKVNVDAMLAERANLIGGGVYCFNSDKNEKALEFFGTYVASASYPMLADQELAKSDTLLPTISYYAVLAADRVGDKDAVIKYAPLALQDEEGGETAMQLMADAYRTKGDTATWAQTLEEGIAKFPKNDYFFATLIDYYSNVNLEDKAMELTDKMLAINPTNKLYLYVKGYLYYNMEKWDESIEYSQKTVEVDPDYAEAYSNAGLAYVRKAQDFANDASTNINDPKYFEDQEVIKKFYEQARPYCEKARTLAPDRTNLWMRGLYIIYYNLNMGPEFEEIEKLMESNK